jgi:hypothetical protein
MKLCSGHVFIPPSAFLLHPLIFRGVTHPDRTVTVRERGVRRGASASRPDQMSDMVLLVVDPQMELF